MTLAETVAAGWFTPPSGRAGGPPGGQSPFAKLGSFCRVALTLEPGAQSDIKAGHGSLRWRKRHEHVRHGCSLDAWRDGGKAPEQVNASRVRDGKVDRTRPLCAWRAVAKYKGSG
ncbi:MAG TPA: hypothetical protein VFB99_16165, partial [Vicinamibacterales bacterium]|nr:hypothetical protein [Vicinamibacterales bacterium]